MAYNPHGRTPARQCSVSGMGSSHSYLDGVPFKISPSFRLLPQPGLPSELLSWGPRCEAVHEEYDYETEEAVLAWARAREEAKMKAIAERQMAERARAALAAAESSSSDSEPDVPDDVPTSAAGQRVLPGMPQQQGIAHASPSRHAVSRQQSNTRVDASGQILPGMPKQQTKVDSTGQIAPGMPRQPGDVTGNAVMPGMPKQQPTPPWQLPLAASVGNTILTPMPIQTTTTKVQSPMAPKAQVDLALFEQEGDPFDNLELQTINDMEELRTLWDGVRTEGVNQDPSPTPDSQALYMNSDMVSSQLADNAETESAASGVDVDCSGDKIYVNVMVRSSCVDTDSGVQAEADKQCDSSTVNGSAPSSSAAHTADVANSSEDFVGETSGDGDYVQIRTDYSQSDGDGGNEEDPAHVYANLGPGTDSALTRCDEEPQELYSNSEAFRPPIPPKPPKPKPRKQSLSEQSQPVSVAGKTASFVFNPAVRYSLPRPSAHAGGIPGRMSQSAYLWSESMSDDREVHPSFLPLTNDSHVYSNLPCSDSTSLMTASTPAFSNVLYSVSANSDSRSANPVNTTADTSSMIGGDTADHHMYSNLPCSDNSSIMVASTPAFSDNFYGFPTNAEPGSAAPGNVTSPTGGALRNAKSNPDLSASAPGSNPAPRSPQPWNPSKPLPPTPVSDLRSSSSSTESIPTDSVQSPSPLILSPASDIGAAGGIPMSAESDPYHRLSTEAKMFVNSLTTMGFSRSRAARAVDKFGADEREVLDHLFHVDKLVEKKFTPALAETGLQLFKNDIQKAEQFLDLFQQFSELGFTSERIQTALVKHQLDRDKALDYLTA